MTNRGRTSFPHSTSAAATGRGRAAVGGRKMSCIPFRALTMLAMIPLLAACPVARAGSMQRDVELVRPRIGQRGTTVEVTIQGMFLTEPRDLVFYKPGIRAVKVEPLPKLEHPIGAVHSTRIEEQVRAVLEIAPDCEPGEHPFRLRTAGTLSVLATFHVSPFPVVLETTEPNDTIQSAQAVEPNVTVLGTVDTDVFKVPVSPGSRLSVEVDCARLADQHYGGAAFDLAVRVLDETGRELAANDENPLHVNDPLVSLKIPGGLPGGHVYVEVGQSIPYPGDPPYCVHIGTFARPMAAFPPGGPTGRPLSVTLLGDPLGDSAGTVDVPENQGTFSWYGDAPSALTLRSSPYPNLLEDQTTAETRVPMLPIAVNGVIEKVGDADVFRVTVKKGDRYRVRVYAAALGYPVDPVIRIRPVGTDGSPGTPEVEADDADAGDGRTAADRDRFGSRFGIFGDILDPSVIWEPKAEGEYLLDIRDVSGGGGPTAIYRIEIDAPPPQSVHFVLAGRFHDLGEGLRATGLAVPQGGRWTVTLDVRKGQGTTYTGPFDIVARGLPDGVRLVSPRVPGNATRWPVQLVADGDASPGGSIIFFEARPADPAVGLESGCHQAAPFVNHPGGSAWRVVRTDRFAMAVTEPAPIAIGLVPPTVALVRGGELSIPVKLTRRPGYDEPIEFQAEFGPAGVGLPPKELIPTGGTEAVLAISAEKTAPLGKGPLYVMATTLGGNDYLGSGRTRVASQFIEIEVVEPFVELASEPASVRRGGRATFAFAVTPKTPFEGNAEAKLLGLPKGVAVVGPPPEITKDSKQIAFEVEATDEALLGPVSGLECELAIRMAGQEIRQRAGKGTLRIDPRL
jgi:hypothetical protein